MDPLTTRLLWVGGAILAAGAVTGAVVAATSKPSTSTPPKKVPVPVLGTQLNPLTTPPPNSTLVVAQQTNTTPAQVAAKAGAQVWVGTSNPNDPSNVIVSVNGAPVNLPYWWMTTWQYGVTYTVVWKGPQCQDSSGTCTYLFTLVAPP